jgi:hypothetical protein
LSNPQAALDVSFECESGETKNNVLRYTFDEILRGPMTLERLTDIAAMIWFELQESYDLHRARASAMP